MMSAFDAAASCTSDTVMPPSPLAITFTCTSRSEEHTSELQSPCNLVCRLLLEKKHNIYVKYRQEQHRAYEAVITRISLSLRPLESSTAAHTFLCAVTDTLATTRLVESHPRTKH